MWLRSDEGNLINLASCSVIVQQGVLVAARWFVSGEESRELPLGTAATAEEAARCCAVLLDLLQVKRVLSPLTWEALLRTIRKQETDNDRRGTDRL